MAASCPSKRLAAVTIRTLVFGTLLIVDKKANLTQADIDLLNKIYQHFVFDVMGLKKEEETGKASTALEGVMQLVLDLRDKAKANKDFATSDEIRNKLTAANIQIKDSKEGTTWSI